MNVIPPEKREDIGLQAVFKSGFPDQGFYRECFSGICFLSFAEVKHSEEECIHRGMTYEIPFA
jgi:DNA-directed RNA polymerase subunit beta